MQLIDNQISDVVESYIWIQSAEHELQSKWRKPLLDSYAQQRNLYEQELKLFNSKKKVFSRRLKIGVWMSSILLLLGVLILPGLIMINQIGDLRGPFFCFSPILILAGLTGWAIIVILWYWQRDQSKPSPPKNPLKTDILYPLLPLWRDRLIGSLPSKKPHPNASGEYHFISRLLSLPDMGYLLYGIHLDPEEKTDLIIVGTKGVWVFKVIYIKGLIRWSDGDWSLYHSSRRLISKQRYEIRRASQAFENQWQSSAEIVSETIQSHHPDLRERSPRISKIRGGLVFTHPRGRYDIPSGVPFNWGVISFWLEKYQSLPILEDIDEFTILSVVDSLLKRNQEILSLDHPRSMMQQAETLVDNIEVQIKSWIAENNAGAIDSIAGG